MNISNKTIPQSISEFLCLGDNFGLPLNTRDNKDRVTSLLETVKNMEVNYKKIPAQLIETTRNNIADAIHKSLCNNRHINHFDRFFTNRYTMSKIFT